ncbi:hypothetical protein [Flavobacterium sp. XS2P14]|uniref:hypothetical protein n=1 Tax=Flavobacterium sp. XS2P14 TaxID=3401735 RepID=UPI003AAF6FDF
MKIFKWFFNKEEVRTENVQSDELEISKIENESKAVCPYCNSKLKKFPVRKTKCIFCKKTIFVRKLNDSVFKSLITEDEAEEIDKVKEIEYLQFKGFHDLENFGVTKDEFLKRKEENYLKYGIENNNDDVIWSLFNELLIKNVNDFDKLRMIYYSMAVKLHQESKDNFKYLQLSAKALLDSCQNSDLVFDFQIITAKDCCENCRSNDGKILSMQQAYLLPVPCKECDNKIGFCRCTYGALATRNSEGMLVTKK